MPSREFDLNIERVLENWTVAHGIRGTPDVSAGLEDALTTETGEVATSPIRGRRGHAGG